MALLPDTTEDLIADLEKNYPPRCKSLNESPEAHAQYAGQVELIQTLREKWEQTKVRARIADVTLNKGR